MSHIHIPAEILLQILAHVRDNGGPNFHLDLLSCSMVSRFWFDCAWPLAAEFFNQYMPLHLDAYSAAQIDCMVDAIAKLRQLRVWKTTPFTSFTSVVTTINKLLFEQTDHGSRADAAVRFVHALQLPSKTLEIHIPTSFDAKKAANIQDFVSKLYSGTTSLRISVGCYDPQSLKTEWFRILVHDLRHQLQDITINGIYPPSFIRALSECPNIRSISLISISNASDASDLMATLPSWPELRSLKILGDSKHTDPIVEQLAMNTPKHLESLHFDCCETPQLRNLIIALAPCLVHLVLPFRLTEGDELLTLIASLDMPCLRHLDINRLGYLLTANSIVQRHWVEGQSNPMSLLRWPKLQRIDLRSCFGISPLFLQLVMASCPALEGVRLGATELAKLLTDAGWTKSTRYTYNTTVTFSRPGGNVWEAEEWVGMVQSKAFLRNFGRDWEDIRKFNEMDGIVIVNCIGIECWNIHE